MLKPRYKISIVLIGSVLKQFVLRLSGYDSTLFRLLVEEINILLDFSDQYEVPPHISCTSTYPPLTYHTSGSLTTAHVANIATT